MGRECQLIVRLALLTLLALAMLACASTSDDDTGDGPWSAPEPPDEFASGLTIGYIPYGFTFLWNEGHESATFHRFESADESAQFAVGRQISPAPYPDAGEEVTRDGRVFTLVVGIRETRIVEEVGNDIRVEVVSSSLDDDALLRIAESVSYDPNRDQILLVTSFLRGRSVT